MNIQGILIKIQGCQSKPESFLDARLTVRDRPRFAVLCARVPDTWTSKTTGVLTEIESIKNKINHTFIYKYNNLFPLL